VGNDRVAGRCLDTVRNRGERQERKREGRREWEGWMYFFFFFFSFFFFQVRYPLSNRRESGRRKRGRR